MYLHLSLFLKAVYVNRHRPKCSNLKCSADGPPVSAA